ncbi:hypothetical protein SCHPADRAFT_944805 [Schizopora paradoxa]|uniref:Uncharacterized protein n=1 Tax=Schizopora paradoxa TaxID=27342 RepID=A0A0H2R9G4_9AGAM|nr:hypothetical protein SCHPADRAFT_944805 [Schizopora paradoxa]
MSTEISVKEIDLDNLFVALQALKENGCQTEDRRRMWCSRWLKSSTNSTGTSSEKLAAAAKDALRTMKNIKRMMDALTKSLEDTIQEVTEQTADSIRSVGFASLPDELIVRVFELLYDDLHVSSIWDESTSLWSRKLASVCKRLRHIALHLPGLWENISNISSAEWTACARERCESPEIFILNDGLPNPTPSTEVSEFLEIARPSDDWRSLSISYDGAEAGSEIFRAICSDSRYNFAKLRNLSIQRGTYDAWDGNIIGVVAPATRLSASDNELLSNWQIPGTEVLELGNIIPSALSCPNLRDLTTSFNKFDKPFLWDIDALTSLLRQLSSIENLTFRVSYANALPDNPQTRSASSPARLPHLKALSLHVNIFTEEMFLLRVMGMIDAPNVSKISMTMNYDYSRSNIGPPQWLSALFEPQAGGIRSFPSVKDLEVITEDSTRNFQELPFDKLLRAIPNVHKLSFNIPGGVLSPAFQNIREKFGCLTETRNLFVKNCVGRNDDDVRELAMYLSGLERRGELDRFEHLELNGCSKFTRFKGHFERLLGGRFTWRD